MTDRLQKGIWYVAALLPNPYAALATLTRGALLPLANARSARLNGARYARKWRAAAARCARSARLNRAAGGCAGGWGPQLTANQNSSPPPAINFYNFPYLVPFSF